MSSSGPGGSVQELLQLLGDYRYLAAIELYHTLKQRHLSVEEAGLLESHQAAVQQMLDRVSEIRQTLDHEDNREWTEGNTLFGIKTSYRKADEEDTNLEIKMEGTLNDLPIFEQCAVIHEIDLFKTWIPFCNNSKLVHKADKADLIGYVDIFIPPLSRDFLIEAYGADCMMETSQIIIIGKSIDKYDGAASEVPLKKEGWFHKRLLVKSFKAIVTILSPTEAQTKIICHVDPQVFLPQVILNFIIKNFAGVFLYLFQQQALEVSKHPDCEHAKRIRENRMFYNDWVLHKLQRLCSVRGWEQPVVSSLSD